MTGQKPREIALRILESRDQDDFIENLLDARLASANLRSDDRALCQELVYGVVRWQATLDHLIDRKTNNRPQRSVLQNLLRLGLYQIFWLSRIPNHAAVFETVALARELGFNQQSGFVNALLRGYLRQADQTRQLLTDLKASKPHLGYSHPEWLVTNWTKRWGAEKTSQLLDWNNTPPKTFARVNTLKTSPEALIEKWRSEAVSYDFVKRDWFPENSVFELKSAPALHALASFQEGLFYVQDPSTLLAVNLTDAQPGEKILDVCAAPGGKLSCLAQETNNQSRIIARDVSADRLKLIQENCARLGVTCATVELAAGEKQPVNADAESGFDRILLDAPCSNTGVMRRRVDLRWRIKPSEIRRLALAQSQLLSQSAPLVKNGGCLIYSTCSLEPEENELLIAGFLERHPEFQMETQRTLLPFVDNVDGAYVAKLRHT